MGISAIPMGFSRKVFAVVVAAAARCGTLCALAMARLRRKEAIVAERAWVQMARTMTETPPPVPIPDKPRGLLALDIDGTLLGPDHAVSAANRAAIRDCGQAGIHVVLASGRSFASMRPYGQALALPQLICLNGAAVGDVASDAVRPRQLLRQEHRAAQEIAPGEGAAVAQQPDRLRPARAAGPALPAPRRNRG